MDIAHRVSKQSYALRLQVGAVCVKDNQIISLGYNGTPPNWSNVCEDSDNTTNEVVIHAEANMIAKLAKSTISSEDSTVFLTHSPCLECAKILVNCGITGLYYSNKYRCEKGLNHLIKCGIYVHKV